MKDKDKDKDKTNGVGRRPGRPRRNFEGRQVTFFLRLDVDLALEAAAKRRKLSRADTANRIFATHPWIKKEMER